MSHPLRVPFHSSGRAKSYSQMYFRMSALSLVRYRLRAAELTELVDLDPRYDTALEQVERAAVEPVLFAGMCVESTLYDLSACLFGEDFAERTDKLDPLGKFFVLAQCVDRKAPSTSSVTFRSLQALVTARNGLVHHKSQSALESDIGRIMSRAQKDHTRHVNGISASFNALVLLSLHFDGNIFEELRVLPSFKKLEYWSDLVPTELHEDVRWCIEAVTKERANAPPERAP
jgi:hypothetical protein